jgi:hypothetical protein
VEEYESGLDEPSGTAPAAREALDHQVASGAHPSALRDIAFTATPTGFEIRYSERLATEHQELVNQSADWLEEQGVLNLGLIDDRLLVADGLLADAVRDGLIAWWAARVEDFELP